MVQSMIGKPGPLTGKVLGKRYLLGDVLGQGGFGMVYEAVQQDLGRTVAVKVLHEYRAEDLHALLRLKLEARAAAGLDHPNIVQVTDFQHHHQEPAFLVMDLLRGCSLKAVLKESGIISQRRAAYIACQVLSALTVAHRAGIIHRDLKPSNIFLIHIAGVKDVVKLLDFGVAKLQRSMLDAELTSTGSAPGTPVYMAPEQILGKEVDGRSDVYSMGVMLYRAITGELPFSAPNDNALVLTIMEHRYRPMSRFHRDLDPELEAVVDRAMAREPDRRFASAREMLMALLPWAPVGVRDECIQDPQGECATVTLPPAGRTPAARERPVFFNETTRPRKPPTLEIVELAEEPPVLPPTPGIEAAMISTASVGAAPLSARKMSWVLAAAALAAMTTGAICALSPSAEDASNRSLVTPEPSSSAPLAKLPGPVRVHLPEPEEAVARPTPKKARSPRRRRPRPATRTAAHVARAASVPREPARGGLLLKVLDRKGQVRNVEVQVDGKAYRSPRVVFLRAGRHVLEARLPMECNDGNDDEPRRLVKHVKVTCRGQGKVRREVLVEAGKTRTVLLGPDVGPRRSAGDLRLPASH